MDTDDTSAQPFGRRPGGFTLVEIMIVVTIIGLLAALAIPAFARIQLRSRASALANDLRVGQAAFETYALENGGWPPDGAAGVPPEMAGYLSMEKFNGPTPFGGNYDWDFEQFGFTAGLSVYNPDADLDTMGRVDAMIDDGNLATGNFRSRADGYILILEF